VRLRVAVVGAALVLGTLADAGSPSPAARKQARKDYAAYLDVYEAHTDHLVLYFDFQTALNVRGTYLSDVFRDAFARERSSLLAATAEDHAAFVARMQSDGAAYHEVVFSADSGMDAADRFGNPDGWQLRLEADGHEEELVTAFRVRDPNSLQRALYPHFNQWSNLWIARFAKTVANPHEVVMHFASGYGHGDLEWTLAP
jgi:hypothetical protein